MIGKRGREGESRYFPLPGVSPQQGRSQDFSKGGVTEATHQIVMSTSTPILTKDRTPLATPLLLNPPTFSPKPSYAPSLSTPVMQRMLNYDCALPNKELLVKGYKNSILFIN